MQIDIDTASKDDLATYALGELGVELVKQKKIEKLRDEVRELLSKRAAVLPTETSVSKQQTPAAYLKHPVTGTVLEATTLLRQLAHLLPCDADGNPV